MRTVVILRTVADALRSLATKISGAATAYERWRMLKKPVADRLVYAAMARCACGAGLAYDPYGESGGPRGYWDCSDILLDRAAAKGEPGAVQHSDRFPFTFYEIKSERQPSANGATTREPLRS